MLTVALGIDIIGITIGLISIYIILKIKKSLGGRVGGALNMFVWGVAFQIFAFSWTIVFTRLALLPKPAIDVHHLLMATGMVLFVAAALKFSKLIQV